MYFLGGKVWPARRADSCAVLVVPNVKARTEAQIPSHPLSLHGLLEKPSPLYNDLHNFLSLTTGIFIAGCDKLRSRQCYIYT
jgi:hypothetical protein